ncbi:MAG: DUF3107 family protein [Nostocaceae cyanobacterium]|nr:DUF3107 family protein [Nostocaceae cyanobacterium]
MQVENVFPQPLGLFTIELGVKNIPLNVFVQRKEAEDAEALYQEILTAMSSQEPNKILELKSEDKTQRKVAVRVSEISAVQISQKDKL